MSRVIAIFAVLLLIGGALLARRTFFHSEKRMLVSRLKALGIDPKVFSEECLAELIERGCGPKVRQALGRTAAIEGVAVNVAWVCLGKEGYSVPDIRADLDRGFPYGSATFFWNVLMKHHPERFALNELDKTQSDSKLLEAEKSLKT